MNERDGFCQCGCGRLAPISKHTYRGKGHVKGKPVRFIVGHARTPSRFKSLDHRFWSKVEKGDGCWLWKGRCGPHGYGRFDVKAQGEGKAMPRLAPRIAWELTHGPIPEGMFVCHHCDNPPCVRPDHLFIGTMKDNMADMAAKKRSSRWWSRLTHCKHGHPFDEANTIVRYRDGGRTRACRMCRQRVWRERNKRRKLARLLAGRRHHRERSTA